jgi:uncharacterized protein DUF6174
MLSGRRRLWPVVARGWRGARANVSNEWCVEVYRYGSGPAGAVAESRRAVPLPWPAERRHNTERIMLAQANRTLVLGLFLVTLGGCAADSSTPAIIDIQTAQAVWASHGLVRYAYRYQTSGFFTNTDGREIHVVVIADTVRSAQFVATSDSVPMAATILPTIDALFALAIQARESGRLQSIQFDPTFGFPTRLVLSGNPDASGSITASTIELLP